MLRGEGWLGALAVAGLLLASAGAVPAGAYWTYSEQLTADQPGTDDGFAYAVDIEKTGNVIDGPCGGPLYTGAVGAFLWPSGGFRGSVYVYQEACDWNQIDRIDGNDRCSGCSQPGDDFGVDVAVSGYDVLVGAEGDEVNGVPSGAAEIHTRAIGGYAFEQRLTAPSARDEGDAFGHAVDLEGDWAVVGARGWDGVASDQGAAFVYQEQSGSWSHVATVTPTSVSGTDVWFGTDVALDPPYLAVGARKADTAGADAGLVEVFEWTGSNWAPCGTLLPAGIGAGDQFGYAVDLDYPDLVVGTPHTGPTRGDAWVSVASGCSWTQPNPLPQPLVQAGDWFGIDVAIDEGRVVVGSQGFPGGDDVGRALGYERGGSGWNVVNPMMTSTAATPGDSFGKSVALGLDRSLVGAPWDDNARGVDAGEAVVFEWQ